MQPKSLARRITSIKAFFRWLHQGGVLVIDPAEKVLQQSVISPLPQVLTPVEVEAVIATANKIRQDKKPDARPYALLLLLLSSGIKKGETLGLSQNHLDLENPSGPQFFVRYAAPRSRYKERKIALPMNGRLPIKNIWLNTNLENRFSLGPSPPGVFTGRFRKGCRFG